jgi:hypothetical protein
MWCWDRQWIHLRLMNPLSHAYTTKTTKRRQLMKGGRWKDNSTCSMTGVMAPLMIFVDENILCDSICGLYNFFGMQVDHWNNIYIVLAIKSHVYVWNCRIWMCCFNQVYLCKQTQFFFISPIFLQRSIDD